MSPETKCPVPARKVAATPPRRRRGLLIGLLALVLVVAGATYWRFGRGDPRHKAWSVLLVTFDTTRADHLSCYGYNYLETPTLDLMARNGIRYARCYSPAPMTLPAHASILTGLYPFYHGVRDNGVGPLHEDARTLAEILEQNGYRTGAVVAAYVLHSRYGLNQGFELYADDFSESPAPSKFNYAERTAQATTDLALRWLEGIGDEPFFLWVHYFDPHVPYQPPGYAKAAPTTAAYDEEIAYADGQLDRLLQRVGQIKRSTRRDVLTVFAADHGESLWDHGEPTHGLFTYDDTLRVPLIVYLPSAPQRGVVIDEPVSLVDIYPSILHWLGLPPSPGGVHGRVLPIAAGDGDGSAPGARPFYFETYLPYNTHGWSPLEGVIVEQEKYIAAPKPEFYDLSADPEETRNLFAEDAPRVAALQRILEDLKGARLDTPPLAPGRAEVDDDESRRKLEALGYIGTIVQSEETPESLVDPKDMVAWHRDVLEAQSEIENRNFAKALELLQGVVGADPDNPRTLFLLMDLLTEREIRGETLVVLTRRMEKPLAPPFDALLPFNVAMALGDKGRLEEAAATFQRASDANPDSAENNYYLACALAALDRPAEETLPLFRKAYELEAGNQDYAVALARCYEQVGDYEEALRIYEHLLEQDTADPVVLNNCAWVHYKLQRQPDTALRRARQAVSLRPDNPRVRHTLACILLWSEQAEEAVEQLQKTLELDGKYAAAHYQLGLARQRLGDRAGARTALQQAVDLAGESPPDWLADARERLAALSSP